MPYLVKENDNLAAVSSPSTLKPSLVRSSSEYLIEFSVQETKIASKHDNTLTLKNVHTEKDSWNLNMSNSKKS
jgi:hypothetical protein